MKIKDIKYLGDYVDGEFVLPPQSDDEILVNSPGDLSDEVFNGKISYSHVNQACEAANKAYKTWKTLGFEERKSLLLNLKENYLTNLDTIAEVISRETGKPLWETKGEVKAMIGKIDITINHSMKLIETVTFKEALPSVDGLIRYKPRGVMSVIGPFNFPGHLPNGHIVPALLTGNTVVFKPSELTPLTGQMMAQMFHESGFPPGVFNLVQGKAESGKRLVTHYDVDGVLFTGSYDVGLKIKEDTLLQHWKILALEMGGKNTTIVWKDADIKKAIYESIVGVYLTAGQRCSCTSKIVVHDSLKDKFINKFQEHAKNMKVGHWSENNFMGPLINETAKNKYLRFQDIAQRENAECILKGEALNLSHEGHYVSPSIHYVNSVNTESVYQNHEIFGPNVAIYGTSDIEEAFEISNMSGFGLVAAIFTKDKTLYEKALDELKVGLLNWNRTTNGASSKLPFGGLGKSGNDRPSAAFAVQYCTSPVASLEDMGEFNPDNIFTGLDFK